MMGSTMKDVAKLAGVSPSTVSRVINNSSLVKKETAEKVLAAIKKLDYQVNDFARGLRTNDSGLIGVIGAGMENPFLAEMLKGIEAEALKYNYNIIFCESEGELEQELNYIKLLKQRKIAGLVIITANVYSKLVDVVKESKLPVIFTSGYIDDPELPCIGIDNVAAAYDAVNCLVQMGHQKIGIIRGPYSDVVTSGERSKGVKLAFKNNNIELEDEVIIEAEFTFESGYIAAQKLLDQRPDLTAIFSFNDEMAVGAIRSLEDRNKKVPDDISVMGFDNIEFSKYVRPSLSTVSQPAFEMGSQSIGILNDLIRGNKNQLNKLKKLLPYKLVIRDSTSDLVIDFNRR